MRNVHVSPPVVGEKPSQIPVIDGEPADHCTQHSTHRRIPMKSIVATALVALSLLTSVAAVSSANAADFGTKSWWDQQIGG